MGFRFYNSSPIYKSYLLSRISSRHKTRLFQSLNSQSSTTLHDNPNHGRIPRRWHIGHSSDGHHHHQGPSGGDGEYVFRLGLAADIFLATGKALAGYLSGSTAVIADAAHSFSDIVLSGVALLSFKAGKAPQDKEHPYGHGKFESLGALGISCMLLATSGGIAWHAFDVLIGVWSVPPEAVNHPLPLENTQDHVHGKGGHHHGIDMEHPILALSMTALSISVKEGLYWITKRAGEKQGSGLMKANAWHHRADAISSVVALIGVGGSILGVKFLDPLAGLLVSGMILKAGLEAGYQSVLELVDAALPVEHLNSIKATILQVRGVKGVHCLRGRRAGSYLFLDVHIEVDPFCSVTAAHGIGEGVRREILNSYPQIAEIYVHIDPAKLPFSLGTTDRHENLEATVRQNQDISLGDKDIEVIVSEILSLRFPEKMEVEQITYHLLQGRIILQIEVVMPPEMFIRDAMQLAKVAEKEIFKGAPDITHVSFQLRLGRPISKFGL